MAFNKGSKLVLTPQLARDGFDGAKAGEVWMHQKLESLHFFALPPEIIIYILQFISPEYLCSALLLSRDFYHQYANPVWDIKLRLHFPSFKSEIVYQSSFPKFLAAYQEEYKDQDKTARKCITVVKEGELGELQQTLNGAFPSGYKIGSLKFIDKLLFCAQWKHQHILNFIYEKYLSDELVIGHLMDGSSYLLEPLKKYSKGSALEVALICRQPREKIGWLIDQGCDVNQTSDKFFTPLMSVVFQGRLDIVKLFVEKDVQINAQNELGASALVYAVVGKRWDIMHFLVEKGADVNPVCFLTPLMIAVVRKYWEAMHFLVEHGASIDTQDPDGYTSLIMAVLGGHFDAVQFLIHKGGNINIADKKNKTALMYAEEYDYWEIVKYLLEKDAKIDVESDYAKRLLVRAVARGSLQTVKILCQKGVDVNAAALDLTPLTIAVLKCNLEIVRLLVEQGASVDLQDFDGRTPLIAAVQKNRLDIVSFLIDHNAKIHFENKNGLTAFSIAAVKEYWGIVQLFLERGPKIYNPQCSLAKWLLVHAAAAGQLEIVRILIRQGVHVDVEEAENLEVVLFLLEQGAIIHDYEILTSFYNAIRANNIEFLKKIFALKRDIDFYILQDLLNRAIAYKKINIAELILLQKISLLSQALKTTTLNDDFKPLLTLLNASISNLSFEKINHISKAIISLETLTQRIIILKKYNNHYNRAIAETALGDCCSTLLKLDTNEKCLIAGMVVLALLTGLLAGLALGLTFSAACDLDVLQIPAIFESFFTSGSLASLSAGAIAGMAISTCVGGAASAVTAGYLTRYGIFRHDPLRSAAYDAINSVEKVVKNSSSSGTYFSLRAA